MAHGIESNQIQLSDAEIAVRAFQLWMQRGCPDSDPQQDWYLARAQLQRERVRAAYEARIALFE